MMEATPIAPFVMTQIQVLFEFEVITLDAPAHVDGGRQLSKGNVWGQVGRKLASRLGFPFGRFDEQPFFLASSIDVRSAHAYPRDLNLNNTKEIRSCM